MADCAVCGNDTDYHYTCNYCGHLHCNRHRMPENHDCPNTEAPLVATDGSVVVEERRGPAPMDPDAVGLRSPPNRKRAKDTVSSVDPSEETWDPAPEPGRERVRTDQLRDRVTISVRLFGQRQRWKFIRLIQWGGLAATGVGAFLFFRTYAPVLWGVGPPMAAFPDLWFFQSPVGNVALLFVGMIVVWLSLK